MNKVLGFFLYIVYAVSAVTILISGDKIGAIIVLLIGILYFAYEIATKENKTK